MSDMLHQPGQGTNSKYQCGCRCPECRAAHAMELRIWRCRKWLEKVYLPAVAQRLGEIEAEMKAALAERPENSQGWHCGWHSP